ncbi:MAG: hypothetical protein ACREBR_03045 [bacterium]
MMYLQEFYKEFAGDYFDIDIYGDGPELKEIKRMYHHGRSTGSKRKAAAKFIQSLYLATEEQRVEEEEEETFNKLKASLKAALSDAPVIEQGEGEDGVDEPISVVRGHRYEYEVRKQLSNALKTTMEFELPKSVHEYRMNLFPAKFSGRSDYAQLNDQYKVFVNPSITEVLCTTTAEALAMGKIAIIPTQPSNAFFAQFLAPKYAGICYQLAMPEPLTENVVPVYVGGCHGALYTGIVHHHA